MVWNNRMVQISMSIKFTGKSLIVGTDYINHCDVEFVGALRSLDVLTSKEELLHWLYLK